MVHEIGIFVSSSIRSVSMSFIPTIYRLLVNEGLFSATYCSSVIASPLILQVSFKAVFSIYDGTLKDDKRRRLRLWSIHMRSRCGFTLGPRVEEVIDCNEE